MRKLLSVSIMILLAVTFFVHAGNAEEGFNSKVTNSHLDMIRLLFTENGLKEAQVGIDRYGRIELTGNYRDKQDVEVAFSLAQSVVGVRWVSPVTPENVRIKEWARKLTGLFPTKSKESAPSNIQKDLQGAISSKYALVVGISRFKDTRINLKYAERDAQEVYSYLVDTRYGGFSKKNVSLLVNENATNKNIHAALASIGKLATANDEVVVYISSHGKPIYDESMNIITYDTDTSSMPKAGITSFWSEDLKDFILKTKAKTMIVVLDVCYSGQAFKGFYNSRSDVDVQSDNQGISRVAMAKTLLGAKDVVFEDDVLKMTETQNSNGTTILISASDQGQRSWESETLKSSFFTAYFLRALAYRPDVKYAFETARPKVIEDVKKEKNADQCPQVVTNKKNWTGAF